MMLSDNVLIAIVAAIPTIVASIGAAIAAITRRDVKDLATTIKQEAASTRAQQQHPDDLPPRSSGPRV